MSPRRPPDSVLLPIAAVERDTGLSKDTLRAWERRYGFPIPERDESGERGYPAEQVQRLRLMKRLLDGGHRPGRVAAMPETELQALIDADSERPGAAPAGHELQADIEACVELVGRHDIAGLKRHLAQLLARMGAERLVVELLAPLNVAIGDAWLRGRLEVYEEHLYTEAVQGVLRQAIARIPQGASGPRVLLTTLPGEPHGLGLLMAEVLFQIEGCDCIPLGVQTPLWDTARAAQAMRADIVALSFTGCMSPNHIAASLAELRQKLPETSALWVGGSAPVLHRRSIDGVRAMARLEQIGLELRRWRERVAGASQGGVSSGAA